MSSTKFKRSPCAIANMLDIVGDSWTLLIIRDLYFGKTTYTELQSSLENIPTNILAQRLKNLIAQGLIRKQAYQERPVRYGYYLTQKGQDLSGVLKAMLVWGNKYIPNTFTKEHIDAYCKQIRISKKHSNST